MNIKDLFATAENGALTYEQFEAAAKESGAKFADLSEGKYVSTSKYNSDIKAKDAEIEQFTTQVETLNGTIATRDTDLADLQQKLADAGQDATKLAELSEQFTGLQAKYDADVQSYQAKMNQQAYDFAVKEFANTKRFSSQAAKRDFIKAMQEQGLQMNGDKLIGGEDFVTMYAEENSDAFYVEPEPTPIPEPEPEPTPAPVPVPQIVAPTPGPTPGAGEETGFHFNFQGVRAH